MGSTILLLASAVSSLGGLIFGYELGVISGALLQLRVEFRLSCVQQEGLVSSLLIGALVASFVGGFLIDRHGPRNSILLSNVLILTGSLILISTSFMALVVGRITVGFAMCISSMSCCIFVSEMVTPDRRGFLVTLYEVGITVGILTAYGMNYILSEYNRGWKWMFGLAIIPTLVQLLSIWFLTWKTKHSLIQRDCSQTECDLMTSTENHEEDLEVTSSRKKEKIQYSIMYLFQHKDNMRKRTLIGLALVIFQQFTGQPNILFYSSTIFHSVGFQSNTSAVLASVGLGVVKVIATLISMVFSDRVGRRPLLISGCTVMALCLITIGLLSGHSLTNAKRPCNSEYNINNKTIIPHLTLNNQTVPGVPGKDSQNLFNITQHGDVVFDKVKQGPLESAAASSQGTSGTVGNWIVVLCLMAVVSAYSIGFGPMTWLLLSEIFPAAVRGRAFAFTSCFNWAAHLLVSCTFLNIIDAIGLSGMFLLYGVIAVAAGVFFCFMLPETKGKTLEQIDKELRSNRLYYSEDCCSIISRRTSTRYQRVARQLSTT
ncbi:solute carrier family 2, facilitated glucose transporter member 10 [Thalassophryne amazonica]|uniref:solute carrier family 2, facilitated glucose transporter member 10 n=1 Tax=Thalassophryne amazonica TaxID=390379 RepID=UPI0014720FEA|nr:solute carrier family 2, facilitated glucose transporter member 10 [Thalassophryne amazonica]XP_034023210.1 solute carrier family 2, facilitated glucose transporter member 10 [Thalassophryne amazonica]